MASNVDARMPPADVSYESNLLFGEDEPLDPLAVLNLAGIDVAFRVDGNHMQPEELPAILARAAHLAYHLAVFSIEEPDAVVGEIGNIQKSPGLIGRKSHTSS